MSKVASEVIKATEEKKQAEGVITFSNAAGNLTCGSYNNSASRIMITDLYSREEEVTSFTCGDIFIAKGKLKVLHGRTFVVDDERNTTELPYPNASISYVTATGTLQFETIRNNVPRDAHGTTVLSGANTFTGDTTVSAAVLRA